jgi:hypothetical protein
MEGKEKVKGNKMVLVQETQENSVKEVMAGNYGIGFENAELQEIGTKVMVNGEVEVGRKGNKEVEYPIGNKRG